MNQFILGNSRFRRDEFPKHRELFQTLAAGQRPEALFITCSDSRISPDLVLQAAPGELFHCRNAGNIVPAYGETTGGVSATIEYAVQALEVEHVVVCGHYGCGVMHALLHPSSVTDMPNVARWMHYGNRAHAIVTRNHDHLSEAEQLREMSRQNVLAQLDNLRTHPAVASRIVEGTLQIHGWVYELETGSIYAYDSPTGRFKLVQDVETPSPVPRPAPNTAPMLVGGAV
jgi:carbonic anhydrase